jgi:hypothetical protein
MVATYPYEPPPQEPPIEERILMVDSCHWYHTTSGVRPLAPFCLHLKASSSQDMLVEAR